MKIYASSFSAAETLLTEAIIGNAIAKEGTLSDGQIVSFTPDVNAPSFDILSGPLSAKLTIKGKSTDLNIVSDNDVGIAAAVSSALSAVPSDIVTGAKPSPSQKPKK
jgi:hypothetical protein